MQEIVCAIGCMMYLPGACDTSYWELVTVYSLAFLHALMHLGPIGDFPNTNHQRTLHAQCTTLIQGFTSDNVLIMQALQTFSLTSTA